MNILLIEDDLTLSELITDYLKSEGFQVETVLSGEHAVEAILTQKPDLVILDVMLPVKDGIAICREVRAQYDGLILMLTAKQDEVDQILGLELGADDYLFKPVKPRFLLAKIKSMSRRQTEAVDSDVLRFGNFSLNTLSREVRISAELITLTSSEYDLLYILAKYAGEVLSRDALSQALVGREFDGIERTIDNKISQLRKKLGDDARSPEKIKTIRTKGYLFVPTAW